MRFALLGDHPDGLAVASALVASGRHQVITYSTPVSDSVRRCWGDARLVADLEEILADPRIEAVIVASLIADRPAHLRRALQSERHVLCVHPPDATPEAAYEAAMIRQDVRCVLLPLLVEARHPAFRRLAELGDWRLLEMERTATKEVVANIEIPGAKPTMPGWDVLRRLGGEIAELSGFAATEEIAPGAPLLLSGRFERGGLFQATLLPNHSDDHWRFTKDGGAGRAELTFPVGADGPATLGWHDRDGAYHEEYWDRWDPWPGMVACFEEAIEGKTGRDTAPISWEDTVRCLELDDAARRSVQRRRSSTMEYQEASETVGFKGTMTLVGCGTLWVVLLLLFLSRWWPILGWLIVPLLVVFLGLQLLRYAMASPSKTPRH